MVDFEFKRSSRICSLTGQPIRPGQAFFSVLVESAQGDFVRSDISADAWQGPPENCLGWWQSRVPELEKGRVYWAPNEVLLNVFQHAAGLPEQQPVAFVMALLLVRKRILQWKESVHRGDQRFLRLHDARGHQDYEIAEVELTPEQIRRIQTELAEKLFTDVRVNETEMSESEGC